MLLELGLALASERSPAAVPALRQAVGLADTPHDQSAAALLAARVLGIWGYHDAVTGICRDALAAGHDLGPAADDLEVELLASSLISAATAGEAWARALSRLLIRARPARGASTMPCWRRAPPSPPATP